MKKYMKWAGIIFLVWYLVSQPHKAANLVHGAMNGLTGAANSLGTFVSDLP